LVISGSSVDNEICNQTLFTDVKEIAGKVR